MNHNQLKTICSLWLANQLEDSGFALLGTGNNLNNPCLKVFYFKDTPELRSAIETIQRRQSNGRISKSKNLSNQ